MISSAIEKYAATTAMYLSIIFDCPYLTISFSVFNHFSLCMFSFSSFFSFFTLEEKILFVLLFFLISCFYLTLSFSQSLLFSSYHLLYIASSLSFFIGFSFLSQRKAISKVFKKERYLKKKVILKRRVFLKLLF